MLLKKINLESIDKNPPVKESILNLFIEVFSGPPRFESWDYDSTQEFLYNSIAGNGDIFYVRPSESCDGFCFGGFIRPELKEIIPELSNYDSDAAYLSALAVREEKRRLHIAKNLVRVWIHNIVKKGAKEILVRSLESSEAMSSLLINLNFKQVTHSFSEIGGVSSKHILWSLGRYEYFLNIKEFYYEPTDGLFQGGQYCVPGYSREDSELLLKSVLDDDIKLHLLEVRRMEP
jgi:ribosomal protein S18 acetylase RimI-like enzyme